MTATSLRKRIHQYIDTAKQDKLKVIYSMIESDKADASILTDKQKLELDKRMDEYMRGAGKNYSWSSALKKIKSGAKKISGK